MRDAARPSVEASGRKARALPRSLRISRAAVLLILASLGASAYFVRVVPETNGDGRLAFAYALVDHATLLVDRYAREEPALRVDLAQRGGHLLMAKPPLPAMLAGVAYAMLRSILPAAQMDSALWRWGLTLIVSGGSLAAVVLITRLMARDAGLPSASLAAGAAALSTPLLLYSTVLMPHLLAAALLSGLVLAVQRRRHAFLAGLLAGALVATDAVAAAGGLALVAYELWRSVRVCDGRRVAKVVVGGIAGIVPLLAYQWAAFGSPVASVYGELIDPMQRAAYATLRLGVPAPGVALTLLLAPRNGLFVVAPLAAIGTVCLVRLSLQPRSRELALLSSAAAVTALLAFASLPRELVFWPDRAEFGPRQLVPVLPLLCWPLASLPYRPLAIAAALCAIPQVAIASLVTPMFAPSTPVQLVEGFRRFLMDEGTPSLLGLWLPGRVSFRMAASADLLVILVVAGFVWVGIQRRPDRRDH